MLRSNSSYFEAAMDVDAGAAGAAAGGFEEAGLVVALGFELLGIYF